MKNFQLAKTFSPNLPWCQDDPESLGPAIMQFCIDQESFRRRWSQKWFENINFVYGNQNIKWSQRYDFAVDVDFLKRDSAMGQKTSTNISRTVLEGLASFIYGNLPCFEAETADESSMKGKRFRKIIEKMLECYFDRLSMDKELKDAATMFPAFGQVGAKVDWDHNAGELLNIPQWKKVKSQMFTSSMTQNDALGGLLEVPTGVLDSQGQPMFQERWEAITDANGKQVNKKVKAGDARVSILTPFEYMREIGSVGMHKTKWIQHLRLLDYDEFLTEYDNEPGRTKHYKNIAPTQSDSIIHSFAVRYFMRLQYITPPSILDSFKRSDSIIKSALFKHKVLVVEHWDRPSEEWQDGRKVVVVNGRCTNVSSPNYKTNKLGGWHPFTECQWLSVRPSSIATGPMNDVIAKNKESNIKDSLIATAIRRTMGSVTLIKTGSGLDAQKLSGDPGQIVECSDPANVMLHVSDNNGLPAVLSTLRQQDKEDIYEVSGSGDAIRGDRSKGASAGYALKLLQEREEKRLTPARNSFENFTAEIGEKLIQCVKSNCLQLGNDVMGFLQRSAAGEYTPQDIVAFLSTPIDYGVDVRIVPGSMLVKSKASTQATLQELAKGPLQQRLGQDAEVLDNYLKYFDIDTLRDASAGHRDRSVRENEVFMDYAKMGVDATGLTLPIVLFEDDDDIHINTHTEYLIQNAEEVMGNEQAMQQVLMHLEQHRIQKKEKSGDVPPGTAMQVPAMMAEARQQKPPTMPQINMATQSKQRQQQQQQISAEVDQQVAQQQKKQSAMQAQPKAPTLNKEAGQPGARPKNPGAPAINSAPTVQGGVMQ